MYAEQEWKSQLKTLQSRIDDIELMKKLGPAYQSHKANQIKNNFIGGLFGRLQDSVKDVQKQNFLDMYFTSKKAPQVNFNIPKKPAEQGQPIKKQTTN